jgi:hypothetical protein
MSLFLFSFQEKRKTLGKKKRELTDCLRNPPTAGLRQRTFISFKKRKEKPSGKRKEN